MFKVNNSSIGHIKGTTYREGLSFGNELGSLRRHDGGQSTSLHGATADYSGRPGRSTSWPATLK